MTFHFVFHLICPVCGCRARGGGVGWGRPLMRTVRVEDMLYATRAACAECLHPLPPSHQGWRMLMTPESLEGLAEWRDRQRARRKAVAA